MSNIDVVIIKPGSQKELYGELDSFCLTAYEPPLWASLLAGYLRSLGFRVALLDAEVENLSPAESAKNIKLMQPLLAVVSVSGSNPSASTMNMIGATEIISCLKKEAPEIKTLFHGLHPSALPEETLEKTDADFVCQGEGFYTLPDLISALKTKGDIKKIQGLWSVEEGNVLSTPRPPVFKDIDLLPRPAWDLLPMHKYRAHNWHCFDDIQARQPYGVLYTSLGCPYNCVFCCINAIFGQSGIRFRSPQNVIEEIDFLVQRFGIRNIKIIDELFAINEKRVVGICDLIASRGYDLNIWAYARVDTITELMLKKMKQAGIHWVAYGFESGSRRVLDKTNKSYDVGTVEEKVRMTYDAGLYIVANFIFGLGDDDFDSMQESLALAQKINAEWANLYVTMAYPGSKLYKEVVSQGIALPETWQGYSQYSYECMPLPTKYLTPGEILSFRDYAFHAYFENPHYLAKINRLFGRKTVCHVQEMTRHRIRRAQGQFSKEE